MDQDNSTSNSINFAPADTTYAPVNGPEPVAPSVNPPGMPQQLTSVSDQISVFGQAQQAAAGMPMTPVAPEPALNPNPVQFAQSLPTQNLDTMPMVSSAAPVAPAPEPVPTPIFSPSPAPEPVVPLGPATESSAAESNTTAAIPDVTTSSKKSSLKSMLILVGVFVLLFGLAMFLGYALGFKAGQASMPGM